MSEWPKRIKYYLHSNDKEGNCDIAAYLGIPADTEAEEAFAYICYEVVLELDVYEDGRAFCVSVNGIEMKAPVRV